MLRGHGRIDFYLVAVDAGYAGVCVAAVFPIIDNARIFQLMAINAFTADIGHAAIEGQVTDCAQVANRALNLDDNRRRGDSIYRGRRLGRSRSRCLLRRAWQVTAGGNHSDHQYENGDYANCAMSFIHASSFISSLRDEDHLFAMY
jgi:hypothetical protein